MDRPAVMMQLLQRKTCCFRCRSYQRQRGLLYNKTNDLPLRHWLQWEMAGLLQHVTVELLPTGFMK